MTHYYVRVIDDGVSVVERYWAVDQPVAHEDVTPSERGTHRADPGEDIMTTLRKRFTGGEFYKQYNPRMARPSSTHRECSPGHYPDRSPAAINVRTTSTGQLNALIQELRQICQVVLTGPRLVVRFEC
jgi:putative lipoic acid-binding regulatory protein